MGRGIPRRLPSLAPARAPLPAETLRITPPTGTTWVNGGVHYEREGHALTFGGVVLFETGNAYVHRRGSGAVYLLQDIAGVAGESDIEREVAEAILSEADLRPVTAATTFSRDIIADPNGRPVMAAWSSRMLGESGPVMYRCVALPDTARGEVLVLVNIPRQSAPATVKDGRCSRCALAPERCLHASLAQQVDGDHAALCAALLGVVRQQGKAHHSQAGSRRHAVKVDWLWPYEVVLDLRPSGGAQLSILMSKRSGRDDRVPLASFSGGAAGLVCACGAGGCVHAEIADTIRARTAEFDALRAAETARAIAQLTG